MNFKFLYDEKRGLFSIGYNVEEKFLEVHIMIRLHQNRELLPFVAIAKNDVPKEHWYKNKQGND